MPNPATTWTGQAQSFLEYCAKAFGMWAQHPAMAKAVGVNAAVQGPAGLAKCSAEVAASMLRHTYNAWDRRANKSDPRWQAFRTAWGEAAKAVAAIADRKEVLDKQTTWGDVGVMVVMVGAALHLEEERAAILIPTPQPVADWAWLRQAMRPKDTQTTNPGTASDDADAVTSDSGGAGWLPLLLLFLMQD